MNKHELITGEAIDVILEAVMAAVTRGTTFS